MCWEKCSVIVTMHPVSKYLVWPRGQECWGHNAECELSGDENRQYNSLSREKAVKKILPVKSHLDKEHCTCSSCNLSLPIVNSSSTSSTPLMWTPHWGKVFSNERIPLGYGIASWARRERKLDDGPAFKAISFRYVFLPNAIGYTYSSFLKYFPQFGCFCEEQL